ncbi:hypothetical protein LP422_17685 [Janibacter limosus]|nr:hypothetical protein LP422_17685 [Janibacter limosus]
MGPDQAFHRAPSTFETKSDAEAWLAGERRLIQYDDWSPTKSRRAKVIRATEAFGPYAEARLEHRDLKPRTRALYRRQLDRFLLPSFADTSLRDITPAVVRVWHSKLDPTKPTQRAHVYGLLPLDHGDGRRRRDHPGQPVSRAWRGDEPACTEGGAGHSRRA